MNLADANRLARELDNQMNAAGGTAGLVLVPISARPNRGGRPKLTEANVRELRRLHDAGSSTAELAARFGVTASQVRVIWRRQQWRDVD